MVATRPPRLSRWRSVELASCAATVTCGFVWLFYHGSKRCSLYYNNIHQLRGVNFTAAPVCDYPSPQNGIDLTDNQWNQLRGKAPYLLFGLVLVVLLRPLISPSSASVPAKRLEFMALWGLVFATVLHGTGIVWLLLLLTINYATVNLIPLGKATPWWAWGFTLSILFASKTWSDSSWEQPMRNLGLGFAAKSPRFGVAALDALGSGLYSWLRPLNLTVLRIISYDVDTWREVGALKGGLVAYLAYVLYPPLYIAGPIVTFSSFVGQVSLPADAGQRRAGWKVLGKALGYGVVLEVALHYVHYHAISHNIQMIFHQFPKDMFFIPPWEIMFMGLWVLIFIYLKFLVIWRASAGIALADGINPPENMRRCVCNNYTFRGFWRSWHSSFHEWVLRYIYLPLGGRKMQMVTVWPIFIFAGAWHDLEARWAAWGLLNCFFFCVEAAVVGLVRLPRLDAVRQTWWWRYVGVGAAVGNILVLMCSNLAILYGFKGSWDFVNAVVRPKGGNKYIADGEVEQSLIVAVWWLASAVVLMFEVRERELEGREVGRGGKAEDKAS